MLGDPVPGVHHLELRAGGETVGRSRYGNPRDDVEDGTGELHAIKLLPDFWSQGLGSRLFRASVEGLRQMGHGRAYRWVAKGNDRAITFSEKHGWALDGQFKDDAGFTPPPRELRMSALRTSVCPGIHSLPVTRIVSPGKIRGYSSCSHLSISLPRR
ncbi:MAG: putative GNAT-family acetyltransferase [Arthrobacter sp.]|nr:putative GNAT-family acetyltransferase [Arthrobacter sp.]